MSTNSIESGGVLGGSSKQELMNGRTECVDGSDMRAVRNVLITCGALFAATMGLAIYDQKTARISNAVYREGSGNQKYTIILEGTPEESIDLEPVDLGEGLTCKGTVVFRSTGRDDRGNHYAALLTLTISGPGLEPYPNGVQRIVHLNCAQKQTRGVISMATDVTGMGGAVDDETRNMLKQKLGKRIEPKEEDIKNLENLVKGKLEGYEALGDASRGEVSKLYDAIIASAMNAPQKKEKEPVVASL